MDKLNQEKTRIEALLGDTSVTSSDFNTVKALVQGDVDTFMGFKFIVTNRRSLKGNEKIDLCYPIL